MIMVSRIYVPRKAEFENIKMEAIKEKINEYFENKNAMMIADGKKPRLGLQEKLRKEMFEVVEVINKQLEDSFRLDLSDKLLSEAIGVSQRRAKQVRLELKAAGITWFPEWSRPKAKGQYPWWMLQQEFIAFKSFSSEDIKIKKKIKNRKYKPQYYIYYSEAKVEAYQELEEWDMVVSIQEYMRMVYQILNRKLERNGLTKEMLLK